ncbi:hypothetical protein GCM10009814_35230 [Lapillicoccus jejuensis]
MARSAGSLLRRAVAPLASLGRALLRAVAPIATPLTTTVHGVEVGLMRAAAGLRLVVLLQAGVIVAFNSRTFSDPPLATVVYLATVVLSVAVLFGVRTGPASRRCWVSRADLVGAAVVLVLMPVVVGPNQLIGSSTAWGYPFALTAVVLMAILLPRTETLGWAVVLTVVYVVSSQSGLITRPKPWTVGVNAGGIVGFAVLLSALVGFLRRLGAAADTTVRSAAQIAAEEERDRARRLLHDHAALLAVLADRVDDAALRRQSRGAANEIVGFLAGPAGWDPIPDGTLADVVRESAEPFGDLPLTVTVELATRTPLSAEQADAVAGAVTTLLHNVRAHADARSVVVHADVDDAGTSWEVTVRDDGVGFDPATTPRGFGLARQVVGAAERAGLHVTVDSAPGEGTLVRLQGAVRPPDGAGSAEKGRR